MSEKYWKDPRIMQGNIFRRLLVQNAFNFLILILGVNVYAIGIIFPYENINGYTGIRIFGMILMCHGAIMITAFYSRHKIGRILQIIIGIICIVLASLIAILSIAFRVSLEKVAIFPFFYGSYTLWALLPMKAREYFGSRGFPDKKSKMIPMCVMVLVIMAIIIHIKIIINN